MLRLIALVVISVVSSCAADGVETVSGEAITACRTDRTPISAVARDQILTQLAWFQASYPLDGQWGRSDTLSTPDTPFSGVLEVTHDGGDIVALSRCQVGLEIPVSVRLQAGDVVVDGVAGVVRAGDVFDRQTGRLPDNVLPLRSVALVAELDLTPWVANGLLSTRTDLTVDQGILRVQLTAFGTRGGITSIPARRTASAATQPSREPGSATVAPIPLPAATVLDWPRLDDCEIVGLPLSSPPVEAEMALQSEIAAADTTYRAAYEDGPEVSVALDLTASTIVCTDLSAGISSVLSDARFTTSDGRVDFSLRGHLALVDGWLWFDSLSGVYQPPPGPTGTVAGPSWALSPSVFEQRFGDLGLDAATFSHVGVEALFRGDRRTGTLRVLGFESGGCSQCDSDGCVRCLTDRAIPLLELSFQR